jgi:deazaflavin-dependent oxidoreductase (nitroreductase family)
MAGERFGIGLADELDGHGRLLRSDELLVGAGETYPGILSHNSRALGFSPIAAQRAAAAGRACTVGAMQRWTALLSHHAARLRPVAAVWARIHSGALKLTRGRLGARWFGAPVLVLVTVGRRSGKVRETPLLYVRQGDDLALLAANAGNDRVPSWWLNLQAAPTADVLVGATRRTMRWREATGDEHARLFAAFVEVYPPSEHYLAFTDRHLPIAVLSDAGAP